MKHRLYFKLLGSYLIFAALAVIILSTFTHDTAEQYLFDREAQQLHRESELIARNYRSKLSEEDPDLEAIQKELEKLSVYLSAKIWIVDVKGNFLVDSSSSYAHLVAFSDHPQTIADFNVSDFGSSYYTTGTFYEKFREETLSVFSTITNNYSVKGYVLIHRPMAEVFDQANDIVDIVSLSVMIVLVSTLAILVAFTFFVYKPIRKITKAAELYAKGDFSNEIQIKSNDEIGYLANTLNYMANTLDTMEEEQRKFISNVSHDFRSPLTSIKGYIEAMLDGTIPVEMQEKYLNIILFETERLNKLTHNILDLNNFGSNGMSLNISDFDINSIIRTTTRTFEGVCNQKKLSFDLLLTEEQLYVKGDMGKIQQVLYNLIDNATKFSKKNTSIIIETSIRNGKVFVSVKDTGIGIPSDSLKKIWDRFYKTDQSRGKDKKGTGLGLAIVKDIIQAHNENINVISTEGVGTEFIFSLPLSDKEV